MLTDAAIRGSQDYLMGLKENVTLGRLIPAGTGLRTRRYKELALEKDAEILAAERANSLYQMSNSSGVELEKKDSEMGN